MDVTIYQRTKEILFERKRKHVDLLRFLNWDVDKKKALISGWFRQSDENEHIEFLKGVIKLFPDVNPMWLMFGEGEKLLDNTTNYNNKQSQPNQVNEHHHNYKNQKSMTDKQFDRVIDLFESQLNEKDKTISHLLSLLDDQSKKKEVG